MSNILKAFVNIANRTNYELLSSESGRNRVNSVGKGLEVFVQDAFAGTFACTNEAERLSRLEETFSYQGNQNNPPDLILKNSDAIEVKKLQSKSSAIALNSSYPKAKLYRTSKMATKACMKCDGGDWVDKDIIYAVGYTDDSRLKSLYLVYGDCFCADSEVYERIKNIIADGVNSISDIEFTQTKELGKVKKVDPLGITDLRIRGMWHIDNPNKIFNYLHTTQSDSNFELICLMKLDKYNSLPQTDREAVENHSSVSVSDVRIKNPNNPVQLVDAKLLVFKI